MNLNRIFRLMLIIVFALFLVACQQTEQEKTVTVEDVPQAVLESFNAAYPGAVIKEYTEETEDGQKYYEISCTFESRSIDAIYHPDGTVSAIEEVIDSETLPEIVQQALAKEVAQFSIKLAEKIDKDNHTFYEVKIVNTQDQKTYELIFSDSGNLIEQELKQSKKTTSGDEKE